MQHSAVSPAAVCTLSLASSPVPNMLKPPMIPGTLPNQLEIALLGQTYIQTSPDQQQLAYFGL